VTVGLATFDDDPAVLALVLDSVLAEQLEQRPLVVDMSRGSAVAGVVAARPRIRYIRYAESAGLSDARNRLVQLTQTRYLLFVDADAVPAAGWASAVRSGFFDDVAVVGARCLPVFPGTPPLLFDTPAALDLLGMFDLGSDPLDVPRVMGTSFAVDIERLPPEGPFSLEHGRRPGVLEGGEEVQLCEAVRRAGWRVRYEPAAVVRHHLRPERASWRWMLRRARASGREARRAGARLEPLPRRLGARDYAFLAAIAPAYFAGKLRG
jgi:glycosyltransferase involved in cell wall biosynthesis